jgi:hypothetical protein
LLAILAGLLILLLAFAPRAEAFVYWTSSSHIGRAGLGGAGVDESFAPIGGFGQVAVDGTHIYWSQSDAIGRAKIDGTDLTPSFITGLTDPRGLAVDAGRIYWASGYGSGAIGRANIDGTGVQQSFIPGLNPHDVAVDANHIYWTESFLSGGFIGRALLNSGRVTRPFINVAPGNPISVAVDASHIYWTLLGPSGIGRANLTGSGVSQNFISVSAAHDPASLAVDPNHIYWTQETSAPSAYVKSIARASIDGTGVDAKFIDLTDYPADVAVDGLVPVAGKVKANPNQVVEAVLVKLEVAATEQLTARASGVIEFNPTYELKPKTVEIAAGKTKTLKLKPKKKAQAKKIAKALDQGKKVIAKLEVKLTGQAGNSTTKKLNIRLKRG